MKILSNLSGNTTTTESNINSRFGYQVSGTTLFDAGADVSAIQIGQSSIVRNSNSVGLGINSVVSGGTGSVAIGSGAKVRAQLGVALGESAGSTTGTYGQNAVSIGRAANAGTRNIGLWSVAVGQSSNSIADYSVSLGAIAGNTTGTTGSFNIAIGYAAGGGETIKYKIGQSSVSLGAYSKALETGAISIGFSSTASGGTNNIAIGNTATARNVDDIAIGNGTIVNGQSNGAVGIGIGVIVSGDSAIGIGYVANAGGSSSISIGRGSRAKGLSGISLGRSAGNTTGTDDGYSVSIGQQANNGSSAIGQYGVAIAYGAKSIGYQSISLGVQAGDTSGTFGSNVISIGASSNQGTSNAGSSSIAIGASSKSIGSASIAIGLSSYGGGQGNIAIGEYAKAAAYLSLSIGDNAGNTSGNDNTQSVTIGDYANYGTADIGQRSIAVGSTSRAKGSYDIALGYRAGDTTGSTGGNSISIGNNSNQVGNYPIGYSSVSIGNSAQSKNSHVVAIGSNAGYTTSTVGSQAITIGLNSGGGTSNNLAVGVASISIGSQASSRATYSIAVGADTIATDISGIAIGSESVASGTSAIAIGSNAAKAGNTGNVTIGYGAGRAAGTIGAHAISIGTNANQPETNIGNYSSAIGYTTSAKNDYGVALGAQITSGGQGAIMLGYGNNPSIPTVNTIQNSFGLVWNSAYVDYQLVKATLSTTDATPSTLLSYTLASGFTYSVEAKIVARDITGANRAMFIPKALVYREGSGSVIEGGVPYQIDNVTSTGANAWVGTIDTSGNDIRVRVTGAASTTINWHVILELTKVS